MLHEDEALLAHLHSLLPSIRAAAHREAALAQGDRIVREAEAAMMLSASNSAADVEGPNCIATRQLLMAAVRRARQRGQSGSPSASTWSVPQIVHGAAPSEIQLREALQCAHYRLDALTRENEDLRAKLQRVESYLSDFEEVSLGGKRLSYLTPDGEELLVGQQAADAHVSLYEVPAWWGRGVGHDKDAVLKPVPEPGAVALVGSFTREQPVERRRYKLSPAWRDLLSPRALLLDRTEGVVANSDALGTDASMEGMGSKPVMIKRASSIGSQLWHKVRRKIAIPGRWSPRPEYSPTQYATIGPDRVHASSGGSGEFKPLADPFGILAPEDDAGDEDSEDEHDIEYQHEEEDECM